MANEQGKKGIGRRGFFGAVAAVASGAVVASGAATPAFAQEAGDERTKARYSETDHVKKYYATNRYYKGE